MSFLLRIVIFCVVILLADSVNASVVSAISSYNSGIFYNESGSLQPNSTAVFQYSLTDSTVNIMTMYSQFSQVADSTVVTSGDRVVRTISFNKSASEYSKSDPGILALSGGTGIYNYQSTALLKDQISLNGNNLFITLVNLSPTKTATFLNQFTVGGAPGVVRGTIVSQASLSAVPLPASFPMFAAALGGLVGFGLYRKNRTG